MAAVAAGCGSSSSQTGGQSESTSAAKPTPAASSIAREEAEAGDQSIQDYGSEAGASERTAAIAAMHAFFRALAKSDYVAICGALTESNRQQLQQYLKLAHKTAGDCAELLPELLAKSGRSEAERAATAPVSRVRIGEGNAFVLFRPAGGKLSYFVMKEEDGAWKATGLTAGTPLSP